MRLRNIPRAESVLNESFDVIKNESCCQGRWQKLIFKNSRPIHLEIGMGKGQFLITLASRHPDINYVGIERYSSVLLRAVEKLEDIRRKDSLAIPNLRFICMDARNISDVFAPGEIGRIYLNFSDPWPKSRHAGRRLTSKEYFNRYDKILACGGHVEFKTDNRGLFDFSIEQIDESDIWEVAACTYDLHNDSTMNTCNVLTEYEEKFSSLEHPICKLIAKRQFDRSGCI